MRYIVCYSGGHSSALVAIEAVRKHGVENVVLLNHDISPNVEHEDIKRFKREVADYLGLEINYANHENWDTMDQFDVCVHASAFKVSQSSVICTSRLKTEPFHEWLAENYPVVEGDMRFDAVVLYGFDSNEGNRITRRAQIMGVMGYITEFPLAMWDRTIEAIEEIGIIRPSVYETYKHANCTACLKAGKQHWYVVYCTREDLWEKARSAEDQIGYSILRAGYIDELEEDFKAMKAAGIEPTERIPHQTFWANVRKKLKTITPDAFDNMPCECTE